MTSGRPQTMGGYIVNITVAPGAVAADGTFNLPAWAPPIARTNGGIRRNDGVAGARSTDSGIIGATIFAVAMGSTTPAYTSTDLFPVADAGDIGAAEVSRVDHNTVRVGTAIGADEMISLCYLAAPEDSTIA